MKRQTSRREEILENIQKIVVKVGTSTLTNEDGSLNIEKINKDRVWKIQSKEDIENYLEKLRKKLEKELEKNEKGQIIADYVRLRFEAVKE